jgi:hypothetical protein
LQGVEILNALTSFEYFGIMELMAITGVAGAAQWGVVKQGHFTVAKTT